MDDKEKRVKAIKDRLNKVSGHWDKFYCNYPFYVVVRKPRPSLSKHDLERPEYWSMEDGLFVANAVSDIEFLLSLIEKGE